MTNRPGQQSGFRKEALTVQDLEMELMWKSGSREPEVPPAFQLGDKMTIHITNRKYKRRCQLGGS